jgi:hypothetical protein
MSPTHPLVVFKARAEARALLVYAGELSLPDAVDALQQAAEAYGLVQSLGQDEVQRLIAEAFEPWLELEDLVPDALPDAPPRCDVAQSTLDAAVYLIGQNDPQRLEAWLLRHNAAERAAVVEHIQKRRRP